MKNWNDGSRRSIKLSPAEKKQVDEYNSMADEVKKETLEAALRHNLTPDKDASKEKIIIEKRASELALKFGLVKAKSDLFFATFRINHPETTTWKEGLHVEPEEGVMYEMLPGDDEDTDEKETKPEEQSPGITINIGETLQAVIGKRREKGTIN